MLKFNFETNSTEMKNLFGFVILSLSLIACSDTEPAKENITINRVAAEIPPIDKYDYDTLSGMYIGDFGGSDIRIIVNYVSSSNVIGYNIHKGLQRNLMGKVSREGDSVTFILNEPGDHKYDGVFTLLFTGDNNNPTAKWVANDESIPSKKIKLQKMIAPEGDDDNVNFSNFTEYFGYVYDSLGNYTFKKDGFCMYEYYPKTDDVNHIKQLVEVKGSWSIKDSTVKIDWQPNKMFPRETMIFTVKKDEYSPYLKGEKRELHNYWW